eukprot:scaffold134003_cov23-Tisochrysis_lutea.AAC.1
MDCWQSEVKQWVMGSKHRSGNNKVVVLVVHRLSGRCKFQTKRGCLSCSLVLWAKVGGYECFLVCIHAHVHVAPHFARDG